MLHSRNTLGNVEKHIYKYTTEALIDFYDFVAGSNKDHNE